MHGEFYAARLQIRRQRVADAFPPRFYVNSYTKKSQWDKPTAPAVDPNAEAPAGPPPGDSPGPRPAAVAENQAPAVDESTRPAAVTGPSETSREAGPVNHGEPASGAATSYMNGGAATQPAQPQPPLSQTSEERGFGNKANGLLGKLDKFLNREREMGGGGGGGGGYPNGSSAPYATAGPPAQQPPYYGGPPPPGQSGAGWGTASPPQPGYGAPPPQAGYYGSPPPAQYGYAPPPQQPQPPPAKKGMGAMGGAALGIGAGLLGGAALASAFSNSEEDAYEAGIEDAMEGRYDSD